MAPPKTQEAAGEGKVTPDDIEAFEGIGQQLEILKPKLASIDAGIEKAKMASGDEKAKLEARVMAEMKYLKVEVEIVKLRAERARKERAFKMAGNREANMSHKKDMFDLRVREMKLRAELPIPTLLWNFPHQMRKWKQFPGFASVPDKLEGNLFPNADGKPSEWHPEDAVGSDNANPARLSLQQTQSCRWTVFMLTGAKEDQRQDEFLKERKETAELADPKAIKMVPVQCQAVPEVEAKSVANALPTCPAVQLNDVPAEAVPRRSQDGSCEGKGGGCQRPPNVLQRCS
uniref:Uncharacterized protein n=1 Tax=Sphaerodactylus townsendi TaxID=933632 RepID=A0ACB8F5I2_9SAUR